MQANQKLCLKFEVIPFNFIVKLNLQIAEVYCFFIETKTHSEMRIPERDVTCIIVSVYLLTLTIDIHWTDRRSTIRHKGNLIKLGFELERNFAQYIRYGDVRIADICCPPYTIYRVM